MPPRSIRVVKLGGSLLTWPLCPQALRRWLAMQPAALNVLVVGGGDFAEAVRHLDQAHHLSPRDAHWLAAETMQVTARLVALLLPESLGVKPFHELISAEAPAVVVADAWQFLREVEPTLAGDRLPQSWDTTSDSIAARLAVALPADELVLLKSKLPTATEKPATIRSMAAEEYVDAAFVQTAAALKRLRCVNLRDEVFAECVVSATD